MVSAPASRRANSVDASSAMASPRRIRKMKAGDQQQVAQQAELFGIGREDEVGGALGMNSRCVWVPAIKPLPVMPPEPMAIMPWMM
jgi:hypothetical protein